MLFQSTLPARGATRQRVTPPNAKGISIHAPRTGSDSGKTAACAACLISIHAPRTGSDAFPCLAARAYSNFNPRSPHGERLNMGARTVRLNIISIHAPRTGSDLTASPMGLMMNVFQSTLPARGATLFQYYQRYLFQFQSTLPARGATSPSAA